MRRDLLFIRMLMLTVMLSVFGLPAKSQSIPVAGRNSSTTPEEWRMKVGETVYKKMQEETKASLAADRGALRASTGTFRTVFDEPTEAYVTTTSQVYFADLAVHSMVNSLTYNGFKVTFDKLMEKREVPGTWGTWNSPPFVESASPHILAGLGYVNLELSFSRPVYLFGMEVTADAPGTHSFVVEFYNRSTLLGSLTRSVDGNNGALLFAAETFGNAPFTRVKISAPGAAGGIAIGRLRFSTVCPDCPIPSASIISQPEGALICTGSDYTFRVIAEGKNLDYQWYKGDSPIQGATTDELTITNATLADYEYYHVVVKGSDEQPVTSDKVRLWVAEPLPANPTIEEYPAEAVTGKSYMVRINPYNDVSAYTWSFSNPGGAFRPVGDSDGNAMSVTFSTAAVGTGILNVELSHICGNRMASQEITVQSPAGIDEFANGEVKVGPNPVTDELRIENGGVVIDNITLLDINGRILYQSKPGTAVCQIAVADLPKGLYFVKIVSEAGTKTVKIVKN